MRMRWMAISLVTALLGFSTAALADPAPDDAGASLIRGTELLKQIFGLDATSLATLMSSPSPTILAAISTVFTLFATTIIVIIAMLTFFSGTMQQGADGAVLGRRYSALWVPLRTALSFFYLVPLASGYAIIQILIVWAGGWSDWLGNKAWDEAITYVESNAVVAGVPITSDTRELVSKMFESAICAQRLGKIAEQSGETFRVKPSAFAASHTPAPTLKKEMNWTGVAISPALAVNYTAEVHLPELTTGTKFSGSGSMGGDAQIDALCGSATTTRTADGIPAQMTSYDQQENLQALADELMGIAAIAGDSGISEDIRNRLVMAEARYAKAERDRSIEYMATVSDDVIQARVEQLERSRDAGWVGAGSWYMTFAGLSDKLLQAMSIEVDYAGPKFNLLPESVRKSIQADMKNAAILTSPGLLKATSQQSAGLPSMMDGMGWEVDGRRPHPRDIIADDLIRGTWGYVKTAFSQLESYLREKNLVNALADAMGPGRNGDPVIALQSLGHEVLGYTEAGISLALLGVLPFAAAAGLGGIVMTIVTAALLPLFGASLALAYYLPMLPYIYWMMGVAGWLLLLLEAVAIAPLWAASHALPEGEGWASQHARHGYILILNILVRPFLMVFGFAAAILAINALSSVFGVTIKWATGSTQGSYTYGLVSILAWFFIGAGLIIAMMRIAFSLIHVIPDRALRWINSHDSIGEMGGERYTAASAAMIASAVSNQLSRLGNIGRRQQKGDKARNATLRRG